MASYVQDFSQILIMFPMKEEYARKLIFLHGLEPWVWKIVYQRTYILDTYQGLTKMVECMEDEGLLCPRVKSEMKSPKSIMLAKLMEANARTNASRAKVN